MKGRSHLSFNIFLVINIVILSLRSVSGDWLQGSEESDEFERFANGGHESDEMGRNGFKIRRNAPDNYERDEGESQQDFDDANIRYILDHIQTRDTNGQTAKQPDSDTFNAATAATNSSSKLDSDISKTFINNTSPIGRPAASPSAVTNNNSGELAMVLSILDQMRDELELMRMSKQCNATPEGANCELNGSWNSEQIGLRLELTHSMTDDKLTVKLSDKAPKKVTPFKIDASWSCSGIAFRSIGGPFYFHCLKPSTMETSFAIFQGLCKQFSGYETVFGQWHFQHTPHDCRQLWTFVESKNDIFRKDVLHYKGNQQHDNAAASINQTAEKSMNGTNIAINNKSKVRRNIKSNHHKQSSRDSF